ncbi:MAG: HAD family hydrolase [Nitrososphaerota archaeon]|nr:HAD family hydrolase [Nitrososphaerota archaeon]
MNDSKAVFLDRDGTVVELLYDEESGYIDSAVRAEQIRLIPGAAEALRRLKSAGYKLIIVSNQPGVAKGRMSIEEFEETRRKMKNLLAAKGVTIDGEYYCLHHPNALIAEYRKVCDCRKPRSGLILKAVHEHGLKPEECYMVGDDLLDIKAGKAAGCKTILLSHITGMLMDILDKEGLHPDSFARNLDQVSNVILQAPFMHSEKRQDRD